MVGRSSFNTAGKQNFTSVTLAGVGSRLPRQLLIGVILILALFAFEMFNFDTTRYALQSLLGDVRFAGLAWATILAVAFCAIDFAGLARLFTPERGLNEPKEIWYLTGAWLLGATMNAIMTWWAVSLVLLDNQMGNEVMSRDQLLNVVPLFVAILVWLTRILFIGAVTLAGERLLHGHGAGSSRPSNAKPPANSMSPSTKATAPANSYAQPQRQKSVVDLTAGPVRSTSQPTRVHRRPPRPVARSGANRGYGQVNVVGKSK